VEDVQKHHCLRAGFDSPQVAEGELASAENLACIQAAADEQAIMVT